MPIYEFKCLGCEGVFDYLITQTDDRGPEKCELCGFDKVEKIMSMNSFSIELSAREHLEKNVLPSARKDRADIMSGNETKMANILGEEKATQMIKNRVSGEKLFDKIKGGI